ncbi:BLOC-2 complex member HPS6 [Heptranchias perlo]|uniref:BLOC-2 complex member HPS6 n=1 Tax=Heptranchias perlo TaxID=212740 RepID=UPI003559F36A
MRRSPLRRVSDLSHYSRHQQLREILRPEPGAEAGLSRARVRCSPDLRHLYLYLPRERRLLSFDPLPGRGPAPAPLDKRFLSPERLLEVLELGERPGPGTPTPASAPGPTLTALITDRGRAEFWSYREAGGWELLQAAELCNSPRARVVSAAWDGRSITWCEERPPSEGHPAAAAAAQHCVCCRSLTPGVGGVGLGGVRILLHNSPAYRVVAAGEAVYLIPRPGPGPPVGNLTKFILVWGPLDDTLTLTGPARGPLGTRRLRPGDSDFRRLVLDAAGLLAALRPLDVRAASPSPAGLLLAAAPGEVSLVGSDGSVRLLCRLSQCPPAEGLTMELSGRALACALGRTLRLFDSGTGRVVEEASLEARPLALAARREPGQVELVTEDGVYALGLGPGPRGAGWPEEMLERLVLEEACKYYQKRSLSSSRLTVERLKTEATFQAPLALCSILQNHLHLSKSGRLNQETSTKLRNIMAGEMQGYASLEEAKSRIVNASESEFSTHVEDITEQEITRLLRSHLDREGLVYLNSIFNTFPREAWKAVKKTLHLQARSDGLLSARATADLWRVVLSPALPPDQQVTGNGAVAVFELICRLLYRFRPEWLPEFVKLTQQHLAASRSYGAAEGPENVPLYKRALSVLPPALNGRAACPGNPTEMAIELLLCSERPNAIIQAVRILIDLRMWQRVLEAAKTFSRQGPLLKKELFAAMLVEISRHRALDPYLREIWELCPEEATAADILEAALGAVPVPASACEPGPYPSDGSQLTVGLLRPLLAKVLLRGEDQRSAETAAGSKTLVFPPPTPPRQKKAANLSETRTSDPLNPEPSTETDEPL